jgi:acyl-CoA reductase-like NAD-dependent aldehyde dehydrogenase
MSTYSEDRYYEPEDDDYEDLEDYVSDYIAEEMAEGGDLDPKELHNFCEAVSELGFPEELENWADATPEQRAAVVEYWEDIARKRGEESYYDNL